jgi:hypothetical protein
MSASATMRASEPQLAERWPTCGVELFRQTRTNRSKIVKAGREPHPYVLPAASAKVYLHQVCCGVSTPL